CKSMKPDTRQAYNVADVHGEVALQRPRGAPRPVPSAAGRRLVPQSGTVGVVPAGRLAGAASTTLPVPAPDWASRRATSALSTRHSTVRTDRQPGLFEHRVLVCVGCGGVGKTSVAAALSVAAARQGKRVLALTVDPAGRLADSLGVERRQVEHQPIEAEKLSQ